MTNSNCPDQAQLLLAVGNGLDTAARAEFELHLKHCSTCQREFATLKTIDSALPATAWTCTPQQAASFATRVERARMRPKIRRIFWQAPLATAATAAIAIFLFLPDNRQPVGNSPPLIPQAEIALFADQELLENLDLLQQLDLLEGLSEAG